MCLEVVTSSVGNANTFHPPITAVQFCVPAIDGVMGHFVLFVLSESDFLSINTHMLQETVSATNELSHSCMADESGVKGVLKAHVGGFLAITNQCEHQVTQVPKV